MWICAVDAIRAVDYRKIARRFPGFLVLRGRSGPALDRVLDRWEDGPVRMPRWFYVVATKAGLEFVDSQAARLFQVDWTDMVSIEGLWIRDGQWSANGLEVLFRSNDYQVEFPIVVFGVGPFGVFNSTLATVNERANVLSQRIQP
jgi:hypothetical protein